MNHFYGASDGFMTDKPIQLSDEQKNERDKIFKKYGDGDAFQTCFLLYHSDMINKKYLEIFNIVFHNQWMDLGDKFLNTNPTLIDINWELDVLKNGYMDTNDYSNITALHFFNFFPPWDENNLRFYPTWKEYHDRY